MCGVTEFFVAAASLGLFASERKGAKAAARKAEKRSEELQESLAARENIESEVVDEIKSAVDSDLDRRERRRKGKRALRSIGLQGIPQGGTPSGSTQAPQATQSVGLGGIV